MTSVGIKSIGICAPKQVRTNDYYINHVSDAVRQKLEVGIGKIWNPSDLPKDAFSIEMAPYMNDPFRGTKERRCLSIDKKLSELELEAAKNALRAAALEPSDIDAIIVTSFLPDGVGAGNAAYLAKALNVHCPAWNLESACSSNVVAFEVAYSLIAAGRYRNVLIIQGCNYTQNANDEDSSSWFLGDGAGAFVVSQVKEGRGFLGFHIQATIETCGVVTYKVNGPHVSEPCFVLESAKGAGKILHSTSEPYLLNCCDKALREAALTRDDIRFFIFSTPTAWYAAFCARALQVPQSKTISTHQLFGNMGPAMTAFNLYAALLENKIQPGDPVLLYQIGSVSNAAATVLRFDECAIASSELG